MAKEEDNQEKDYTTRNTLTVGLFAGAMVGFYLALWLGIFEYKSEDSITEWIVAVTAIAAAFISSLAVVLVAQTLKATRDTLKVTVKASNDQTRAWVLVESVTARQVNINSGDRDAVYDIRVLIKNYGNSPALNLNLYCTIQLEAYPIPATPIEPMPEGSKSSYLAQRQCTSVIVDFEKIVIQSHQKTTVIVRCEYETTIGKVQPLHQRFIPFIQDGQVYFRQEALNDLANFNHSKGKQ